MFVFKHQLDVSSAPVPRINAPQPRVRVLDSPVRVRVEEFSDPNLPPRVEDRMVEVEEVLDNPDRLQRETEH